MWQRRRTRDSCRRWRGFVKNWGVPSIFIGGSRTVRPSCRSLRPFERFLAVSQVANFVSALVWWRRVGFGDVIAHEIAEWMCALRKICRAARME